MLRKVKKLIVDPHPDPDQHQTLITSRASPLVHDYTMFGRRLLTRSRVILLTDRQTDRTSDRTQRSHNLRQSWWSIVTEGLWSNRDGHSRSRSSICWWTNTWSTCDRYSRPAGTPGIAAGAAIHWPAPPGWLVIKGCPETQIETLLTTIVAFNYEYSIKHLQQKSVLTSLGPHMLVGLKA